MHIGQALDVTNTSRDKASEIIRLIQRQYNIRIYDNINTRLYTFSLDSCDKLFRIFRLGFLGSNES